MPKRMSRLAITAIILAGASVGITAAPARAAATCVGEKCYNVDPVSQSNCSHDGYAVRVNLAPPGDPADYVTALNTPYGTLHLMYSPSCQANWAEVDNMTASQHAWMWVTDEQPDSHGRYEYVQYQPNYSWGYTSMVDGQLLAAACVSNQSKTAEWCLSQS